MNVRQLQTIAKQIAVIHGHEEVLRVEHLPPELRERRAPSASPTPKGLSADVGAARELIEALKATRGKVVQACEQLGISRARAYRLMTAHGITPQHYRMSSSEEVR
jgi:transcriptional regulator of acetoin/glycerol metabolism